MVQVCQSNESIHVLHTATAPAVQLLAHLPAEGDIVIAAAAAAAAVFQVDEEGWSAAKQILSDAVSIWVAWAMSEHSFVDAPPPAADSQPGPVSTRSPRVFGRRPACWPGLASKGV